MHKIIKGRREREKYVHLRSATPQKAQVYRHTLFNQVNEIRRESTTGASHHWFTSVQNVGMAFIIAANVMVVVVVVVASYCYCSSSASSSSLCSCTSNSNNDDDRDENGASYHSPPDPIYTEPQFAP